MREHRKARVPELGLERLLTKEENISDLLQLLSHRDFKPWTALLGFEPTRARREAHVGTGSGGIADLLLEQEIDEHRAAIEVKLGHDLSSAQRRTYERTQATTALFLLSMAGDDQGVTGTDTRWTFVAIAEVFARWMASSDDFARAIAAEVTPLLREWDEVVVRAFTGDGGTSLMDLPTQFLTRILSRRISASLASKLNPGWVAASKSNGGGHAIAQGWIPATADTGDSTRCLHAEFRWKDKPGFGELRFGVDFDHTGSSAEQRAAAWDLAKRLNEQIRVSSLRAHLESFGSGLTDLLETGGDGRPNPRGDWSEVVERGFTSEAGARQTRASVNAGFYGDGTGRFQAVSEIDLTKASGYEIAELLNTTLSYLGTANDGRSRV